MPVVDSGPRARDRFPRTRLYGCLAVCLGLPVLVALALVIVYAVNNRPPEIVIPNPAMPPVNAWDDFVEAGQMARAMKHPSPYSMPGTREQNETLANYAACAHDAAPIHALVRQGLSEECVHPPVRSYLDVSMAWYALFREVARMLAGEACYYERTNRPGLASDTLLDGMEMAAMFTRHGPVMSELVAFAVEQIMVNRLEPLMPRLSPTELRRAAIRLDRIKSKRSCFSDFMLEEANTNAASLIQLLHDPKHPLISWDQILDSNDRPDPRKAWDMARLALANKAAMIKDIQAYYRAVAKEARQPYRGRTHVRAPENDLFPGGAQGDALTNMMWESALTDAAMLQVLQAEAAAFRYRAACGRFPDRLEALVPRFLPEVPYDPFGGAEQVPLRYRALDGGRRFRLYSVGPDMKDDGGAPAEHRKAPSDEFGEQVGDIAAGHLAYHGDAKK